MTESPSEQPALRKRSTLGLVVGAALGLAAAAGAWVGVAAGHLPAPVRTLSVLAASPPPAPWDGWMPPAFVELDPLTVSLGPQASARHLRVGLVLEVEPGAEALVEAALPQVRAGLARFLRAVDERDFETPGLMLRLQAQMARRARLAGPPGAVSALLIQDFVLK